jgi:hypothetical protein
MISNSLFNLQSVNSELDSALAASLFDFGEPSSSADFWAMTSLQRNIESAAKKIANKHNSFGGSGFGINPPRNGFRVTFGLQILVSHKIRLRRNVNLGYGKR